MNGRAFLPALFLEIAIASASTLVVPDEYPTIQTAIDEALEGDTVLVMPGMYLTDSSIDFLGKDIVVKSQSGPDDTIIHTSYWQGVSFLNGESRSAVFQGFTLTRDGYPDGDPGWGIYSENSSPTIVGNIIENHYHIYDLGAGIYCSGGSPLIVSNVIEDCYAFWGGGICLEYCEDADIIGNVIKNNAAGMTSYGGSGGGIAVRTCYGSTLLTNNLLTGNEAHAGGYPYGGPGRGGAIAISGCSVVTVENSTIALNDATTCGGGIYVESTTPEVRNSILFDNTGGNGYQVYIGSGILYSEYCDIMDWEDSTSVWGLHYSGPGMMDADPLFETGPLSDFHLSDSSPCIDAGNPDPEYNDPEDPSNPGYALWPALGGLRNDMGVYGGGGAGYWVGIEERGPVIAGPGTSIQVFPSPFVSSLNISFYLQEASMVSLAVYDIGGRLVEVVYSGATGDGEHEMAWCPGSSVPSGCYLIVLDTPGERFTEKSVLIR